MPFLLDLTGAGLRAVVDELDAAGEGSASDDLGGGRFRKDDDAAGVAAAAVGAVGCCSLSESESDP